MLIRALCSKLSDWIKPAIPYILSKQINLRIQKEVIF